jgi:hypothetical protein
MSDNKSRPTTATDVHVEVKETHTHGKSPSDLLVMCEIDFCFVNISIQFVIVIFFQ